MNTKLSGPQCSYCGCYRSECKKIIAGDLGCYICDQCIQNCYLELSREDLLMTMEQKESHRVSARESIESELRWIKKLNDKGELSDCVYSEAQRDIMGLPALASEIPDL